MACFRSKINSVAIAVITLLGTGLHAESTLGQVDMVKARFSHVPHPSLRVDRDAALRFTAEAHIEIEKAAAIAASPSDFGAVRFVMSPLLILRARLGDHRGTLQTTALYIDTLARNAGRNSLALGTRRDELDWLIRAMREAKMFDIAARLISAQIAQLKAASSDPPVHEEYYELADVNTSELIEGINKETNLLRRCNFLSTLSRLGRDDAVKAILKRYGFAGFVNQSGETCYDFRSVVARLSEFSLAQQLGRSLEEHLARPFNHPIDIKGIEKNLHRNVRSHMLISGPHALLASVRAMQTPEARHEAAMTLALGFLQAGDVLVFERMTLDPHFWPSEESEQALFDKSSANLPCFLIHLGREDVLRALTRRAKQQYKNYSCFGGDVKLAFSGEYSRVSEVARKETQLYFSSQPNGEFSSALGITSRLTNAGFIASGDPYLLRMSHYD